MKVVYLDNAATTPVDPRVVETMLECCGPDGDYANPSAVGHEPGRRARARVERARAEVASVVGQLLLVDKDRGLFQHGATDEILDRDLLGKIYGAGIRVHRHGGRITIEVERGNGLMIERRW